MQVDGIREETISLILIDHCLYSSLIDLCSFRSKYTVSYVHTVGMDVWNTQYLVSCEFARTPHRLPD